MKIKKLKNYLKIDGLHETVTRIKKITDFMDNNFWFQDKFFNNICYIIMFPIWKIFRKSNPRIQYCQDLVWQIFKIDKKEILMSKEFNYLIHGPWISLGYFTLKEIPNHIDEFHTFMNKCNKIKLGYSSKVTLKNNKKWNTIICKKGYFNYKKDIK